MSRYGKASGKIGAGEAILRCVAIVTWFMLLITVLSMGDYKGASMLIVAGLMPLAAGQVLK